MLGVVATAATAFAQERQTQVAAYVIPDDEGWGLGLSHGEDSSLRIEVFADWRREDALVWEVEDDGWEHGRLGGADVYGLQAGLGRYWLGPTFYPFVSGAVGVTVAFPDFGPVEAKGYATFSAGGGFELWLSDHVMLRLDGRAEWVDWKTEEFALDWRTTVVEESPKGSGSGFSGATHDRLRPVLRLGLGIRL